VTQDVCGFAERVHDRGDVRELLLDRVAVRRVAALPAAAPVDRMDSEAVPQQRLEEAEAEALDARPVNENERRPRSAALVSDPRSIARPNVLH
jgi:hypothetical protein